MNAQNVQTKQLTRLATAVALALAFGTAGAANVITFDGEATVDNGLNNAANIDASDATNATVTIRQINTAKGDGLENDDYDITDATVMNQVGDYVGSHALTIGSTPLANTVTLKIGQGALINGTTGAFEASAGGSANNIVTGNIEASQAGVNTLAYIGQTGTSGARAVHFGDSASGPYGAGVGLIGGTLKATQSGEGDVLNITAMSGGTLTTAQTLGTGQTINVKVMADGILTASQTGDSQTLNVVAMNGGTTNIYQGQKGGSGDDATGSTLWFDSGAGGVAAHYATVDVYQTGSYQQTNLTYANGGFNGALNLDQHGLVGGDNYATLDIKL